MRRSFWAGCLLVAVAGAGCKRDGPMDPSPAGNIVYSAIAASDGVGFGGSVPCFPFDNDCPSGTGYVYLLKRRLQGDGRNVTLTNVSLPGAVLSPAMQALSRDVGRDVEFNLQDRSVPFIAPTSTHVTIFTGGNDANVIAQNVRAGRGGADIRAFIDQQGAQWGTDLVELVRRVRARAPAARLVALNLPNLGAAPYVAGLTLQERSILQRIAVTLTDRVNALTAQNVLVIDLMCDPRVYDPARFSSDGFHPNDQGYALMADLTYPALAAGTAPAPSASCAQRTLLPVF